MPVKLCVLCTATRSVQDACPDAPLPIRVIEAGQTLFAYVQMVVAKRAVGSFILPSAALPSHRLFPVPSRCD